MAAETYPAVEDDPDSDGLTDRLRSAWRSFRSRDGDGSSKTTGEDADGPELPESYAVDADELGDLIEDADKVFRDIPLTAWDPTLSVTHPDRGYRDSDEVRSHYDWIRDEWELDPGDLTVYHSGRSLQARCTVQMTYDGTLDADETASMEFRLDLDRYLPKERVPERLDEYGLDA